MKQRQHNPVTDLFSPDRLGQSTSSRLTMISFSLLGSGQNFFEFLLADEKCPHGIIGQDYRPGTKSSNGSPFHHLTERDTEVDVLIGAYAFTREHLKRVFDLAAKIGVSGSFTSSEW